MAFLGTYSGFAALLLHSFGFFIVQIASPTLLVEFTLGSYHY